MSLLAPVCHHDRPFGFFTCKRALPQAALAWLIGLFDQALPWQHHQDSFYRAYLSDVSDQLAPTLREALVERMQAVTGLPLTEQLRLTVQRMEPGQYAAPHTDRPLLGYEAARLIVQLNPDWRSEHGGALRLHPDERGDAVALSLPPRLNSGFGFVMGPRSFHSVQPVTRTRRTAVFNFWHAGNSPALARWVHRQLDGMRFDQLPAALDPLIDEAERTLDEEDSARAAGVACLLQRWGLDDAAVAAGYLGGRRPLERPEGPAAVLLARWVHRLWCQDFDSALWAGVKRSLERDRASASPPLRPLVERAFP